MQTNCEIFSCEGEELSVNWCSDGIILDLSDYNGEYVLIDILVKGFGRYKYRVLVENNLAKVDWKPSEYLQKGRYNVQLTAKDSEGANISIISNDCQSYCGINFLVMPTCEEGYIYINEKCGTPIQEPTNPQEKQCSWLFDYKTCTWILNNGTMIEMFYDGKKIIFNHSVKKDGMVNDDFLDELDLVEKDAFVVSIIGGDAHITYTGLNDVRIFIGAVEIQKTCV